VRLPFQPPIEPMLAKSAETFPSDDGWLFEPKWDGFRAIVFRDADEVLIQSRDLKPLDRYFPELEAPLRSALPERCILDGEVVIVGPAGLDFEALLLRIHPAASRVALLAAETPASFVAWDLLALDDDDLRETPQAVRRSRLETALGEPVPPIHLTPATRDRATAVDWFDRFEGAGLDGVIAKRLDAPYQPGKRAMLKLKHRRTADCVVAGFRWHKNGPGTHVGSLLLGLYDDGGHLHHVGITSSFSWDRRAELVQDLAPLRVNASQDHPWGEWAEWAAAGSADASGQRLPGATSRWNRGKDLSWEPLRPERVVEVAFDHLQGDRFRHATTFVRWRPDKPPSACRYDQLAETPAYELMRIFGAELRGA
jgi:ATP-dependent DNA ligase